MNNLNAAIDIGGTKIAIGLGNCSGEIIDSIQIPTRTEIGPAAIVANIISGLRGLVRSNGATLVSIGVGSPSPIDVERGIIISPSNLRDWSDVHIVEMLQIEFGVPVKLENDANAAALGEHKFGAGIGFNSLFYMTVSTGIGGGIIMNGDIVHGICTAAGEIGHTIVQPDGVRCNCGSVGCLETICSGVHIARRTRELLARDGDSVMLEMVGNVEEISAMTVVEAVKRADRVAIQIWDETCKYLAIGIANAITLLAPELVVVGGGISSAGELLFSRLRQQVPDFVSMVPRSKINIVPAKLGTDSGLFGALAVSFRGMETGKGTSNYAM